MRRLLAVLAAVLLVSGCMAPDPSGVVVARPSQEPSLRGMTPPSGYPMPDLTLTDTAGQDFNLQTSPSRPMTLLVFGDTSCADSCPHLMADLAAARSRLDPRTRDDVQVIFVTTDPQRDRPTVLRAWLNRFDRSFVGLTGDRTSVLAAAESVGVAVEGDQLTPGSGGLAAKGAQIDHSAQVIAFDRHRRGVVIWTEATQVDDIVHDLRLLAAR